MKKRFCKSYLPAVLAFAPLMPLSSIEALEAVPIYQAQANTYEQSMQMGYIAIKQRDYSAALTNFKQALQKRPGDQYATTAVRNIEGYIAQRRTASQGKNSLSYMSSGISSFNLGIPGRRVPGASRGETCMHGAKSLTALSPETNLALTQAGYPTLFFYIPRTSAQTLELVVQDAKNKQFYKGTFKASKQPGIVSLSLPANSTLPPLKVSKKYYWMFSVVCDHQDRSKDLVVEGTLQRMPLDPNLTIELKKAQPQELAALYSTLGFWQDTLATLANLRRSRPHDLGVRTDWENMLKSVGLKNIAQESLVPCCTVQK